MNRTSLSVIALAVGAVLIIGLYNVYKPQTKGVVDKVFGKIHTSLHSTSMNEHHYNGLTYIDHGHGDIEFTHGTLKNTGWWGGTNFVKGANVPKDISNASSIKFDNVDATHVKSLSSMFWWDENLKSVDFGDNFDTSNVTTAPGGDISTWGLGSMFQSDDNLEHVNFGNKFKLNKNTTDTQLDNMFYGDHKLQKPTGNVDPHILSLYNHRNQNGGYPTPSGY